DGPLRVDGVIRSGTRLATSRVVSLGQNTNLLLQPTSTNGNVLVGSDTVDAGDSRSAAAKLYVEGDIYSSGRVFGREVGSTNIVQLSSQTLKRDISQLSSREVTDVLDQLHPVKFVYQDDADQTLRAGFIAEDTPSLLTSPDKTAIKILDVVAVLTRSLKDHKTTVDGLSTLVKDQQLAIASLQAQISQLEQSSPQPSRRNNPATDNPRFNTLLSQPQPEARTEGGALSLGEINAAALPLPLVAGIPPEDPYLPPRRRRSRRRPKWTRWPLVRRLRSLWYRWLRRLLPTLFDRSTDYR
ncbi:MAG: tail fiber domain-containing protein, partial [Elainellaceae cyanobacterium]